MGIPPKLLEREAFKAKVFARDNRCCIFCDKEAQDAHHILDRKLFSDGGYYIDNGASVCHEHHIDCEKTLISVEDVRKAAGITNIVVPDQFYPDEVLDKWGNPILPSGRRLKGELFHDDGAQKALKDGNVLDLFTHHVKYPRTYHAPWSSAVQSDDKIIKNLTSLKGERIIGTVKMDGESATLYNDYYHARSIDGRHHPSRDWIKSFWSSIRWDIPDQWRVCGENLFARHSIAYNDLPSFFMGFSVWNERNVALPWDETLEWLDLLGIAPVEVVYDGPFDPAAMKAMAQEVYARGDEGIVFRTANKIAYRDFPNLVIKDVRPGHVQTDKHWMHGAGMTEQNQMAPTNQPRR